MPKSDGCRCFIVKHGLDAFKALPNFIWRTGKGSHDVPRRFNEVRLGDRWIGFAYTTSDNRERPLSLVTGFYECTRVARYRHIPREALSVSDRYTRAWMIEGEPYGKQPRRAVGVLPINNLLSPKRVWNNQAIIPITVEDFDRIRAYTLSHQLDTEKIPFLGREPECEQELLAAVVYGHKKLGIEKIFRVRKAFPDLLVKIERHAEEVHLELEVYSDGFFAHGHNEHLRSRRFKEDGKPVAVLCWIEDNKKVRDCVHRVYELQSLIREGKKIRW